MEETPLEKTYLVTERTQREIEKHGSKEKALNSLKAELNAYEDLWGRYSCDALGHGITCTRLIIERLEKTNGTNL